jgi:TolB-like protein/Flp pilus assembly protein TadD
LQNSIAVLPFAFLSDDPSQAYIADGLSDTVMHMLSKVSGLSVTARTSAFYFKDKDFPASVIAKELNVAHLLEGSVQKAGSRVRIIASLIEAASGRELWSDSYDRELEDLFVVQDEIAGAVMSAMQANIMADDIERATGEYRPDMQAYEQLILGRAELAKGTVEAMQRAEQHFQRAIELDPGYAWAHVNLAQTWHELGQATGVNRQENLARISALVDKALELDPGSGEAWDERAKLQVASKAFDQAEQSNLRALELAPSYAPARVGRGHILMFKGDNEGYLEQLRIAADLDPTDVKIQRSLASALWANARAEEAIVVLKENLRLHPGVPGNYSALRSYLQQMGRSGEALRYNLAQRRLDPDNLGTWFGHCLELANINDREGGIRCLEAFLQADPDHLDAQKWLAGIKGDYEGALQLAELHAKAEPSSWYRKLQWAYYATLLSDWELTRSILEPAFPQLLEESPQLNDFLIWPARMLAQAWLETGAEARAGQLLQATLDTLERMRIRQSAGFTTGVEDAQVYALMGEPELALERLEEAIDSGWQYMAEGSFLDSNFNALRDDPRFVRLQQRIERILAEERAYFEANKDQPLF